MTPAVSAAAGGRFWARSCWRVSAGRIGIYGERRVGPQAVEQPGALGPAITLTPEDVQPVLADADANGFAIVMWSRTMVTHTKTGVVHARSLIEARELELR